MKIALLLVALLSSVVCFADHHDMYFVPTDEIYVPSGFDSNDNAELVVTGYLPNLCYHSPKVNVDKIENNTIYVSLKAHYKHEMNNVCPEIIVPITETVGVGVLKKGKYNVVVNQNQPTALSSKLTILDNNSPYQDDYIYLYVDYVKKDYATKKIEIVGLNPSDCFKFEEVKFISNSKNAYSVLPILKKTTDFCPMKMTPMTIEVEVPSTLSEQKVLLHVRSMEGKSYNTLFMNLELAK